MSKQSFVKHLIQGKIAEVIFQQMFSEMNDYTVIPTGYEQTTPIIAQYQRSLPKQADLQMMRKSPDFVLLSNDKREIMLIEVKFLSKIEELYFLQSDCKELIENWSNIHIFLVTPEQFYFGTAEVLANAGKIERLSESIISEEIQENYLNTLANFV